MRKETQMRICRNTLSSHKTPGTGRKIKLEHWKVIALYLMIYDVIVVNMSYAAVLWLRFDCHYREIPQQYMASWLAFTPVYTVFCMAVFWYLQLYQSMWRFASYNELTRVVTASGITATFHTAGITVFCRRMPVTYYVFGALLQFIGIVGIRFGYRFILLERGKRDAKRGARTKNVMLIGAGAAGQMLMRDIHQAKELNERVRCIIDDNPNKWRRFIDGVKIVGGREEILAAAKQYAIEKIYVAIPSASAENKRNLLNICKETGCEMKSLPGLYQLADGEVTVSSMQRVEVEDLLGREPITVNMDEICQYITGKVILVTGGGGSIGSELCRQIAKHNPKQIIIFDVYENNAYEIEQELRKRYPELNLVVLIGSVRDSRRVNQVFEIYRPDIVYHAAAHKHVPLMEGSPNEAIKNNVIGTYKTAYAAMRNGCRKFVLISSDKAVNPTNIMGASKRLCEMVIQTFDKMIKEGNADRLPQLFEHALGEDCDMGERKALSPDVSTEFVAVRFGNVLGSNGSVIPLFKKQIASGGPVTVTHPDIIRYFMTIQEAVSLVLQAGTYARGGEIFVLDMGEPIKIDDLARNLIQLSGYKPDVDIKIEYSGLRPGEKLYEEKLMAEEGLRTTPNNLIYIGCPIPFDTGHFLEQLEELMEISYANSTDIKEYMQKVVMTYHPA